MSTPTDASPVTRDTSSILLPGPWEHRFVAANGARFHVAELGEGPLVLLVHGFPQFWWTWRHQLVGLAEAGYRAVAVDLRGYGASDKPPQGYDARTLAADLASVVRCLGETRAIIVGHGIGGWLAWSMPTLYPEHTRAIAVLGSAHPVVLTALRRPTRALGSRRLIGAHNRVMAEHKLLRPGRIDELLRGWSCGRSGWPSQQDCDIYSAAMSLPFTAHSVLESYRWIAHTPLRMDGRRYLRRLRAPIQLPVIQLHGAADAAVSPQLAAQSAAFVTGPYQWTGIPDAGHFPQEEAAASVTHTLRVWLSGLPAV
ncbi:MAG TPA: alpha/beta hydrolase [Dermatophilaceae bacterium]|nr:alpha/beta hydrolase [Dermatophilaceae bacterium]